MSISNEDITELAVSALKTMHAENGDGFKFPADLIWSYTEQSDKIPSTARPHQPARLVRLGWLEKTGAMTKAASQARAGSPTSQYRFGPRLIGRKDSGEPRETKRDESIAKLLVGLQVKLDSEGYIIAPAELANFFLALRVSPLVILSGISGTGKSLLPRKFAKSLGAAFKLVPVQPQWADSSDIFGYVPTLAPSEFKAGVLIPSIIKARNNPDELIIVVLDEMNLAPVEHYLSDFLSVAETRERVDGQVITDHLPIELPNPDTDGSDKYQDLRNITLPPNLRVIGTANMDETTHLFSPKVLDRAFTIEFDDPDLTAFPEYGASEEQTFQRISDAIISQSEAINIQEAAGVSSELFAEIAFLLQQVQDILAPAGVKFGYRTRDAILLYLHYWHKFGLHDVIAANAAVDFCLLQKVLPKIAGTGDVLLEALRNLSEWLSAERTGDEIAGSRSGPFMRSHEKTKRMIHLLELDGATSFWGV